MSDEEPIEELFGEGPRGKRRIVISDEPNPLACPNCDTVGEWVRDSEDPNKILCARDGTHIMTQVDEQSNLSEQIQDMAYKIENEGLDYFLNNYIDMVPDVLVPSTSGISLLTFAREARKSLEAFENYAREVCAAHGVEYEQ